MSRKKEEIVRTFDDFWNTWALRKNKAKTIDDIHTFFDQRVTAIGSGEHEKGRNLTEVIQNFAADFEELETPIDINFFYKKTKLLSPTSGMVEAEGNLEIEMPEGNPLKFHLRFSTVFVYDNNRWSIIHNHVSIPSDGQNIGEAYPIDELKAKNDRLQKQVAERTEKLQEKTSQLQAAKDKTEELLHNILPKKVANELLHTGKTQPARHEDVSVLFTDFVGFTKVATGISARKLVEELNEIFFHFDDIVKLEKLEKIKTIGDSYMAVCGLPDRDEEHAFRCVKAAKKMLEYLDRRNKENPVKWQMRIGIHSGPVVAGVVGNHKFTYDLWGNTVNIASRLEGASQAGKINISKNTYDLIKSRFSVLPRGPIKIKGDKEIDMYFVH